MPSAGGRIGCSSVGNAVAAESSASVRLFSRLTVGTVSTVMLSSRGLDSAVELVAFFFRCKCHVRKNSWRICPLIDKDSYKA